MPHEGEPGGKRFPGFQEITMKFFAILLVVSAFFLVMIARAVHADPVAVQTRPAPPLSSGVWVNGTPTTVAAQRGKVVVLLFWTHQCINCKHNLGFWNDWSRKYQGTDVAVLSVHTPETASERRIANVRRFVKERGLLFPVVTDNDSKTWNAFGVQSWPTEILIDKTGRVRAKYEGELDWQKSGEYKVVAQKIEALRAER